VKFNQKTSSVIMHLEISKTNTNLKRKVLKVNSVLN